MDEACYLFVCEICDSFMCGVCDSFICFNLFWIQSGTTSVCFRWTRYVTCIYVAFVTHLYMEFVTLWCEKFVTHLYVFSLLDPKWNEFCGGLMDEVFTGNMWSSWFSHMSWVRDSVIVISSWFSHMSWVRDSVICHTFPSGTNEVIPHMNDSSHINDDYYLYKPGNMWSSWFSHMSWVRDSVICHTFLSGTNGVISHMNDSSHINDDYYRVAKTHRIPYLYRSFSAKVTYI